MAIKIEIINQALVITDTVSSEVIADVPKGDYYYDADALENDDRIIIKNKDPQAELMYNIKKINLSDAVDSADASFTKQGFIDFTRANLGIDVSIIEISQAGYDALTPVTGTLYLITS